MRLIFNALVCFTLAAWITGSNAHVSSTRLHQMRAEFAAIHHP